MSQAHPSAAPPVSGGRALPALKGLVWFVALSHMFVGLGIMLSPAFHEFMAELYGAEVTWTPELTYLLRPMGVFMFGLGLLGVAAARDPLRYRVVIFAFVVVLLLRVSQRVVHAEEIAAAFELGVGRQVMNGSFFFVLALALLGLTFAAGRQRTADRPRGAGREPGEGRATGVNEGSGDGGPGAEAEEGAKGRGGS